MAVNLKWRKACAIRGMGFTKDELAAGWPESFALHRLAILQSPADNKMANILHRALKDACAAGSLPSAPAIVHKIAHEQRTDLAPVGFARRNIYGERELDYRTRMVPVTKAVEVPAVTAADFAAWLAAQGETPSEHVAAWFESQGVTDAATTKPAEPVAPKASPKKMKRRDLLTPVIEAAQRECSDPYDAPAVFAVLKTLAESKKKPLIGGVTEDGIQWEDEKGEPQFLSLKKLRDRLNRQKKPETQPQKAPLKRVK